MTEKNLPVDRHIKFNEAEKVPAKVKPMNTWKHMVAHVCIWFLVIVLVMVYFTSTGSPQAGLLEVGMSALIFVVLFHLVMKYFPLVSKIITSVIAIGFGIALIFVNYHYLKVVKTDASLKQLLVGDLLVHKILKTIKKEPIALVIKKENPQAVTEPKSKTPAPAASLDQLKTSIAEPIASDTNVELLHVTSLEPAITSEALSIDERYKIEPFTGKMVKEISHFPFSVKECEPTIRCITEKNDMSYAMLLGVIQDTPITGLKEQKIQPPLSGKIESIPVR